MDKVKQGEEYWTWLNGRNPIHQSPLVKKVKIKEVFPMAVTADIIDSFGEVELYKEDLYETQGEAIEALHKVLDGLCK